MKKFLISGLVAVTSLLGTASMASARMHVVNLSARSCWFNTGIYVNAGDTLTFNANGQWSNGGNRPQFVGPHGYGNYYHPYAESAAQPFAALLGKVSNGPSFMVGNHSTWTARRSGYVQLGMNDLPGQCYDNAGMLNVQIDHQSRSNQSRSTSELGDDLRDVSEVIEGVGSLVDLFSR